MASNRQKAGVAPVTKPAAAPVVLTPGEQALAATTEARGEIDGYTALVTFTEIKSANDYDAAAKLLGDIRAAEVKHEDQRTSITQPMNQSLKAVNALFKPLATDLANAKSLLSGKMLAFTKAEDAKRRAAEQAAEETRKREQAEADRKLAEAMADVADGKDGAEARLEEAALEVSMAEISTSLPAVAAPPSKGGHATRKRYLGNVTDQVAFLRHVASLIEKGDATLDGVVEYNLGKLNTLGTNTNGALRIPGVTFTADEKIVARSTR